MNTSQKILIKTTLIIVILTLIRTQTDDLNISPLGCGYDVVRQRQMRCFVDYTYNNKNTYHGYPVPDSIYCQNPYFSYFQSDYSKMQTQALNFTAESQQSFSADLDFSHGNWSCGLGYEETYNETEQLLKAGENYFASSQVIYPFYYCRLQASYEEGISYLANLLATLPSTCSTVEDMQEYISLVMSTGTHYVVGANFGGMGNWTVSLAKSAMSYYSFSEQEEILNAGIVNVKNQNGVGLTFDEQQMMSLWNANYAAQSFNYTYYIGGTFDGSYDDWVSSLNYETSTWLPVCNSLVSMDLMVPIYVPQSKRSCYSQAIWQYWNSFGTATPPPSNSFCKT